MAARRRHAADGRQTRRARRRRAGLPLADVVRRVQALHARRLPGRLPDRLAVPHRVRHGRGAGRHLQRLRLLRPGLPVRRDRAPQGPRGRQERRHRPEVHALLRPARRRADARLRPGLPDRSRSSSATSTSCASGPTGGSRSCTSDGVMDARLYGDDPRRRRRRRRRVLPAARRARGLRPAAGPGGHHPGPAAHVQPGDRRRRWHCSSAPLRRVRRDGAR